MQYDDAVNTTYRACRKDHAQLISTGVRGTAERDGAGRTHPRHILGTWLRPGRASSSSGPNARPQPVRCTEYRVQSTPYTTPHSGRDRWMSKAAGGKQVPTVWREFCQPKQEPWVMCPPPPACAESARRPPCARFARLPELTAWR